MNSNGPTFNELRPAFHQSLVRAHIVHSCVNCMDFNHQNETCELANARPPANVVVFGCPKWTPDIPF